MEVGNAKINYKQSSNLQGVIMETISSEYAGALHNNRVNPYSQFVVRENNSIVWYIKTLTEEAYKNIILPISELKEFELKKKGVLLKTEKKTIQMLEPRTLLDEFYEKKCSRYMEINFLTPVAFKSDGKYIFYPDLKLIYGSLMRKYSELSQNLDMIDLDTLEELCQSSEIVQYRLQTIPFPLEKVNITGFVGKVGIKVKGPETLARYIRMLVHFGEFSGIGIKTAIGMGAIKYGGKRNE